MMQYPPCAVPALILWVLISPALAADATAVNGIWPSTMTYHILKTSQAPDLQQVDPLSDRAWQQAEPLGPLFSRGAPESPERGTDIRMLCANDRLYIAARCLDPQPEKIRAGQDLQAIWQDDSVEFIFTERPDRRFPYIHLQVNAAGAYLATRILHPFAKGSTVPLQVIDPALAQVRTGRGDSGWWAAIALPMKDLRISQSTLFGNVVRNRPADGSDFAWTDLWSGWFQDDERFNEMTIVDRLPSPSPHLKTDGGRVTLAVGLNRIELANWQPSFRLLCNNQAVTVSPEGIAEVRIDGRGPVRLQIVDPAATPVIAYSAEVLRPLLVEAANPFQADLDKPLAVKVSLNTAGICPVKVTLTAHQAGRTIGTQTVELSNGVHEVSISCKTDRPGEVEIRAMATIGGDGDAIVLAAKHHCMLGTPLESFDAFRPELDVAGDTRARYRLALADACNYYRLLQAGDGQIRSQRREVLRTDEESGQMVYAFALIYTADWPENPYRGDKRFLEAAAAGLEAGLAGEIWHALLKHPPNWRLQSYLLAYELLKDEVPAEQAQFWRDRLAGLMEATVNVWLRPATYKLSHYSHDVGTGSNHFAYHTANVFTAGRVLDRPDWTDLARVTMRRFAHHGRDGFFPERRDIPAMHYNWMSANALAEYYWQSGDEQVLPTLLKYVDFVCHTLLPPGNMMVILHDGRNNEPGAWGSGESALSLTPQGRWMAEQRCRLQFNSRRQPGQTSPASWFRVAENAKYFRPGNLEAIAEEFEYPFLDGRALVVRRHGFTYGLSAICIPPTTDTYQVDPQNAVELSHATAGRILSGANSQEQPEAGSFCRKLADRTEFLPVRGHVERTDSGHAAVLEFDTFRARVTCEVLSPTAARIAVDLLEVKGTEPIVYSFFPVAEGTGDLKAGRPTTSLSLQSVDIRCSQPVHVETGFRIVNPYTQKRETTSKPVRAYTTLGIGQPFILDIVLKDR